jgi:hypothetical protein
MRRALLLLIIFSLASSGFAQKKKKEGKRELPDQVLAAQFIYVTGWHGDDHDWRTPSEERSAIVRVQRAVQTWGRYRLVYYPDQADIMMVVKPGHVGAVQGGIHVGLGGPEYPTPRVGGGAGGTADANPAGMGIGAEGGSPDDYLMIALQPSYQPVQASYIWKASAKDGLDPGKIKLLEDFKRAVEESEKARAAAKKP